MKNKVHISCEGIYITFVVNWLHSGAEYLNEMMPFSSVFGHFMLSVSALMADPKLQIFSLPRQLITMTSGLRSP